MGWSCSRHVIEILCEKMLALIGDEWTDARHSHRRLEGLREDRKNAGVNPRGELR